MSCRYDRKKKSLAKKNQLQYTTVGFFWFPQFNYISGNIIPTNASGIKLCLYIANYFSGYITKQGESKETHCVHCQGSCKKTQNSVRRVFSSFLFLCPRGTKREGEERLRQERERKTWKQWTKTWERARELLYSPQVKFWQLLSRRSCYNLCVYYNNVLWNIKVLILSKHIKFLLLPPLSSCTRKKLELVQQMSVK